MIRIAVAGAAGRMGRALLSAVQSHPSVQLAHAFERPGHEAVGVSAAVLTGESGSDVTISDSVAGVAFDVLIDFTSPASSLANLEYCVAQGCRAVIGTTGFDSAQRQTIEAAAGKTALVWAPNMSVGVNITLKLLEVAAKAFGDDADIEVIEAHHKHKVDAPSGTALRMGEVVADALGRDLTEHGVFARHGVTGPRGERDIGFSTIRAADTVGEHSVWFAGAGERVEITHKASSREIYANGAVRSAIWIMAKTTGLYDMQDVLGLRDG